MSITTQVREEYNFLKRKNFKVCITKRFFEQKSLSTTTSTTCIQSTFIMSLKLLRRGSMLNFNGSWYDQVYTKYYLVHSCLIRIFKRDPDKIFLRPFFKKKCIHHKRRWEPTRKASMDAWSCWGGGVYFECILRTLAGAKCSKLRRKYNLEKLQTFLALRKNHLKTVILVEHLHNCTLNISLNWIWIEWSRNF